MDANQYDVVIVGSGSAGLCAAMWLARYKIRCKILEKRQGPLEIGQADGVQCRTVEVFESFNLEAELLSQSYHVLEVTFWAQNEDSDSKGQQGSGGIRRMGRTADTVPGLSHLPHVIMNQAKMNSMMIEDMRRSNRQEVDYEYDVRDVKIRKDLLDDQASYPVEVVAERHGKQESFHAKYVLAADGAHSAVRRTLGFKMVGDSTDAVWGVMDVYVKTNFPDIRKKATIRSKDCSVLIIPREGGFLTRFYVELERGTKVKEVDLHHLQEKTTKALSPYNVEFKDCAWWSAYSIGQRLADFMQQDNRVFLAGDACHTHSPKAGQGMNTSLQDGYNIGWKLGSVLRGQADPKLLETYVLERHKTAADLIDFDRYFSKIFASDSAGQRKATPEEFRKAFVNSGRFMAGLAAHYGESVITTSADTQLARNITIGTRLPSSQLVRFCDSKSVQLLKALQSDGRWRIIVFGGNPDSCIGTVNKLGEYLVSENSPCRRLTPQGQPIDSFIEVLLVLCGDRTTVEFEQLHQIYWPESGERMLNDVHKVYFDDESYHQGHGHAFDKYGIDPNGGCVVVVRPDQYVSAVVNLDQHEDLSNFFAGVLLLSA